jgi:di/tricarboxylate transporter
VSEFFDFGPWQMWATFGVIAVTIVLYALERYPIELVSAGSLAALLLLFQGAPLRDAAGERVLDPGDLFAGFASPGLIAIVSLLIIAQGIFQSGASDFLTRYIVLAFEKRPRAITGGVYVLVFLVSAFLNDTPVVVMFIPVVAAIASTGKIPPSRLMMPLSFAALLGGTTTIIGSSTNILAASSFESLTGAPIGFFAPTPLALVLGAAGLLYLGTVGRALLPRRVDPDPLAQLENRQFIAEIELTPEHSLVGKKSVSGLFPDLPDVTVRMVLRRGQAVLPPFDDFAFWPHDIVIIAATRSALTKLLKSDPGILQGMLAEKGFDAETAPGRGQLSMVEAVVAPGSRMVGRTLPQLGLYNETGCVVIGIERRSRMIRTQINTIRLEAGDVLLVVGPTESVLGLRADRDLLVLEWSMTGIPALRHARTAAVIFAAVVAGAATGIVPIAVAGFVGALAMVGTECLNLRQAARAIDMRIYMLIGSSFALAAALEQTGGARLLGVFIANAAENWGPAALLSGLFLICALTTNILSNNATALLFTPIAVSAAIQAGIDPMATVLTVIFGANCPFATPIGYQTNLLVMTPGHYMFRDFLRVGAPLLVVLWIVYSLVAPIYFAARGML